MAIFERLKKPDLLYPLAAVVSFLIIFWRREDAILLPQFWAEDGKMWFAQAYNNGIVSLFSPEAGYIQTFPRLIALLSQMFPLAYGPLIMNLCAIAVQITVALFIISPRFSELVLKLRWRIMIAFFYLALPHSWEITANVTNSQWHLAFLTLLIILAKPAESALGKIFDVKIVTLSLLTGPFCLMLLPIAAIKYFYHREHRRDNWTLVITAMIFAGCVLQATTLVFNPRPTQAALGANIGLFFEIIGRHVFTSAIIGENGFATLVKYGLWNTVTAVLICLVCFSIITYAIRTAPLELKLLIMFCALILTAALVSPAVSDQPPQWENIAKYDVAFRYWFMPMIGFFVTVFYVAANAKVRVLRYAAIVLMLLVPVGIVKDWKQPRFTDMEFSRHAAEFERAAPGTAVVIPINPGWEMTLIKK